MTKKQENVKAAMELLRETGITECSVQQVAEHCDNNVSTQKNRAHRHVENVRDGMEGLVKLGLATRHTTSSIGRAKRITYSLVTWQDRADAGTSTEQSADA